MSGHFNKIVISRLGRSGARSLGLAAAIAVWAAPAPSQAAPITYPSSRSLGDISAWLQRETPLSPTQVVDIGPSAVTAVISASPTGVTRGFLANIASEAVDPEMLAHDGIASWSIPVEIDCEQRQVRLGAMTGYRSRDLRTDSRVVREADTAWVNPTARAPLASVIRALCDRDYRRPLMGSRTKLAALAPTAVKSVSRTEPKDQASVPALRPSLAPQTRPAAASGGAFTVQIGASPSLPDVQGLVVRFKKTFVSQLTGLTASVATVQVGGKIVNRALVSGFASAARANAFCKSLAGAGQACFIRR